MSGFRVALPNPDAVDSWMVKNRLYPKEYDNNFGMILFLRIMEVGEAGSCDVNTEENRRVRI